jgi:tetratricopeptide (TPR) repeat protein
MSDSPRCSNTTWCLRLVAVFLVASVALPLGILAWAKVAEESNRCSMSGDWIRQGHKSFEAGNYGLAAAQYGRALAIRPGSKDIANHLIRARVWHLAWTPDALAGQQSDDILADIRRLENTSDTQDKATAKALEGQVMLATGRSEEGATLLDDALTIDSSNGPASLLRAISLQRFPDRKTEVIRMLNVAAKVRPQAAEIQAFLGRTYLEQQDVTSAIEHLANATRSVENPNWLVDLGRARLMKGETEPAMANLMRATQLDPKIYSAWSLLGQALMGIQKYPEAIRAFEQAAALQESRESLYQLGTANNRIGNFSAALGLLQKASQGAADPFIFFELAIALEGTGNKQEALRIFGQIAQMSVPEDAQNREVIESLRKSATEKIRNASNGTQD